MISISRPDNPLQKNQFYKEKCKEIATKAKIPLIQVAYRSGKTKISFESAQYNFIKESSDLSTIFQGASLSKPVFAYLVLRMADRGEISLDTPLYRYTGIERFKDKDQAKLLTARMVLAHKSGLSNWSTSPSSDEWPIFEIEFKSSPDSCFAYSGEGYALLQRAVENIKQKSLQEIAAEEVFIPLKMTHTSYEWEDYYERDAAQGYNKEGENYGQGRHPRANCAYTIRTTADDYSKFLTAMAKGKGLKNSTHKAMFSPVVNAVRFSDRKRACDQFIFWGLGVGIEKNPEFGNIIFHWGDNGNFKALFIVIPGRLGRPEKHLVYFTNSAFGHDIINQIVSLFFNNKNPLQLNSWVND